MKKKTKTVVLGGTKHPRTKLLNKIGNLAFRVDRTVDYGHGKQADTLQARLDVLLRAYLALPVAKHAEHVAARVAADKARRKAEAVKQRAQLAREAAARKKREKAEEAREGGSTRLPRAQVI